MPSMRFFTMAAIISWMFSTDSSRAGSMKAQVFTSTTSAISGISTIS